MPLAVEQVSVSEAWSLLERVLGAMESLVRDKGRG